VLFEGKRGRESFSREQASDADVAGTGADHDYYYNDQWQLLTETNGSTVKAIYHWHPFYVDALAVRMRTDDTHYFTHDAN
jgi:hypothetical protein